jgi:hypothetical protein
MTEVERWVPVPGWPGYETSNHGRLRSYRRSGDTGKPILIATKPRPSGYHFARLWNGMENSKVLGVHAIVLMSFVGPKPPGMDPCHIDGKRDNNRLDNLRWGTRSENQRDSLRHGTHGNALLRERDIPRIWQRLVTGEKPPAIAKDYATSPGTIYSIKYGQSWVHITSQLPGWPLHKPSRHDVGPIWIPAEYRRQDIEIWKPVPGWPGYEASNRGRAGSYRLKGYGKVVFSDTLHFLDPAATRDGHLRLCVSDIKNRQRSVYLHTFILVTFAGPQPKGYIACHDDGNPANNDTSNLRWDTHRNNILDKYRHGTFRSALTPDQRTEIMRRVEAGESPNAIAADFGVHPNTVREASNRKTALDYVT